MTPRPILWGAARLSALALLLASCTGGDQVLGPQAGGLGASASTSPVPGSGVFITELMPDPNRVTDANGEWFEVYNAGPDTVNLQGWRITSGPTGSETHVINASLKVPGQSYVVLGNNTNGATNGGVAVAYSYGTQITLNNSNTDWLTLKTAAGVLVDSVAYAERANGTPGSFTPPRGASKAVIDINVDNTIVAGANWETSTTAYGLGDFGTPGSGPGGVIVVSGPVASVVVSPSPATVGVGGTRSFAAVGLDSAGRNSPTTFRWRSSNAAVARVDSLTGIATGLSEGLATITATSANGVAGSADLSVSVPGGVASISISVNNPRQAPVGYTKPAFPTLRNAEGGVVSPPPALTWTSSDASIATVDSLGYITGVAPGAVTIRATAPNGIFGSVTFTVIAGDAPTPAVYRNHVEFGTPSDATPADEFLLEKRQFVSSYNAARGGPNWVSWNINATQFGSAPRCDCFSSDRELPSSFPAVVDFNYRNGGYDRGHMVQSESRTTTDQENASTFLLTNILPQAANNNQGPWSKLENHLNDLARQNGKEIYVIAGGEYSASPQTLKGEGVVAVPEWTWKVAVVMDAGEGVANVASSRDLEVIAIRMPNDTAGARLIRNDAWEKYATTVDAIEARVGYDLLSRLPDRVERVVESGTREPVAAAGGPYTSLEGASVTLDASASTDPDGDALEYAWDFGDGTTGTGATPTHTYADNGNYRVTLTVTDPYGAESVATTSVVVINVAPQVAAFGGALLLPGETYTASGSFADPGSDEWTATVDFGDGAGARPLALSGKGFSLSHTYAAAGTYTVTVRVSDDDGETATRTATVTVQSPAQAVNALAAQVATLTSGGTENALNAKLRAAGASLERGNAESARGQLGAFVNQVEALVASGRLTAAQGEALTDAANRILRSIA